MNNIIYLRSPTTGEHLPNASLPEVGDIIQIRVGYEKQDLVNEFYSPDRFWGGFVIKNDNDELALYMEPPPPEPDGSLVSPPWPKFNEIVAWKKA